MDMLEQRVINTLSITSDSLADQCWLCVVSLQSIHCACAILGQVNDLLGNKFKSAVLTRLSGEGLRWHGIGGRCPNMSVVLQ